jgi:leucyl aminopeptidase
MPRFRSKADTKTHLRKITVFGKRNNKLIERTVAEGHSLNLVRWLTALPPNVLDAGNYRKAINELAKENNWKTKFYDEAALRKLGAGAFLAVSQGNARADAGIMHIKYRPKKQVGSPELALVGKGIVFDTGGTNLKPFKGMLDMHEDMAGSAVALGTLLAISELKVPFAVDCWLAITENRISAKAYKSRDIVTASNGTTIEVIHTDAEGRMALADTLALAGKKKPKLIMDFATLTGTCVSALTERYSGAFSNREELHEKIHAAGRSSGERVWTFPMDKDFDEELRSRNADVLQCAASGGGDHIQAARFLQRFVPKDSAWIHFDLSSASRTGGLAQVPGGPTGFGVRFSLDLLLDQKILKGLKH